MHWLSEMAEKGKEGVFVMDDQELKTILSMTRRIALVGASTKPDRPSYGVMKFLLAQGYDVVPVNPALAGALLHERKIVGTLAEAAPFDMLDLFRRPTEVMRPVEEAIALGAKSIWMQLGIVNQDAAKKARQAGLAVVMNRCLAIEISRLCTELA